LHVPVRAAGGREETGWIGKPVRRVEDARLLTGRGTYIDDHPPVANARHAAIVRSPVAHAKIRRYDLSAALPLDGVVRVLTGEDAHTPPPRTPARSSPRAAPRRGGRRRRPPGQAPPPPHQALPGRGDGADPLLLRG